jgi:hypothetical protein
MAGAAVEKKKFFDSVAIAAGGNATRSIPVRGATRFTFYLFGTLGGGAATVTFSALGTTGATAVTTAGTLAHVGMVEIQAPTSGNVGTTGATGAYQGIEPASGTPCPISGHNFDVNVAIAGGTGAVIQGFSIVSYI